MIVSLRQVSRPSGVVTGADIDTKSIDREARRELKRLVAATGIRKGSKSRPSRNRHSYELIFEWEDGSGMFVCDEDIVPDAVNKLIRFLKKRSRPVPSR